MRLKYSLSLLQMVPWCFAAAMSESDLEDCSSSPSPSRRQLPIRVVGADGVVRMYEFPVSAAEVMTDNPCHLVCRADAAFTIGQKVPALSAADSLLPGHSYFLLPSQFFHSVLSFVSLASSLLVAAPSLSLNGGSNSSSSSSSSSRKVRPFRICRSATGALQIIVCSGDDGDGDGDGDQLINSNKNTKAEDDKERMSRSRVCTDEALEKEYREMVGARRERRWTPKLETIGEYEMERRRRRRGGGGGGGEGFRVFGFVRRKRGTTQ